MMKVQSRWGVVLGVLVKEGATVPARAIFYKAVVKEFLLYGIDIWVIADSMMKVLEGFHHHIDSRIAGNTAQTLGEDK